MTEQTSKNIYTFYCRDDEFTDTSTLVPGYDVSRLREEVSYYRRMVPTMLVMFLTMFQEGSRFDSDAYSPPELQQRGRTMPDPPPPLRFLEDTPRDFAQDHHAWESVRSYLSSVHNESSGPSQSSMADMRAIDLVARGRSAVAMRARASALVGCGVSSSRPSASYGSSVDMQQTRCAPVSFEGGHSVAPPELGAMTTVLTDVCPPGSSPVSFSGDDLNIEHILKVTDEQSDHGGNDDDKQSDHDGNNDENGAALASSQINHVQQNKNIEDENTSNYVGRDADTY